MSAALLKATLAYLATQFDRTEVQDLRAYGGEFNVTEVGNVSYNCPAILVTVLGWQPAHDSTRLVGRHVRKVRMAAFVATKHVDRIDRMATAQALAEKLALVLRIWVPDCTGLTEQLAPLEDEPAADNLYSRAIDAKGQALWLVDWMQCVKPAVPLPGPTGPGALVDLLRIDITDHTNQGLLPPDAGGTATPLIVTDDVLFNGIP